MNGRFVRMILALCLAAALVFCAFPASSFAVTMEVTGKKGSDYTNNKTVADKLQKLFDGIVYSSAPYFTVSGTSSCGNTACADCALKAVAAEHPNLKKFGLSFETNAYGSGAFARFVLAWIFDAKVSAINYFGNPVSDGSLVTCGRVSSSSAMMTGSPEAEAMSAENLKKILKGGTPGDLIQCRSAGGANHSMILLSAESGKVDVLHTVDYDAGGIGMNKAVISSMTYDEIIGTWGQVISLMRVDASHYTKVWGGGEHTHNYTDEGGDKCTVCGQAITPKRSVTGAGVYAAISSATVYKYCYRSSGKKTTVSKGGYIEALGTIVNSVGKSFYILPDGYAACEDFEARKEVNAPVIMIGKYPSGEIRKGNSFGLSGTVTLTSGLSFVAGYILLPSGGIVQSVKDTTSKTDYDISSGKVNDKLRFSSLAEGTYTYMVTACGKNGLMSCFISTFTVSKNAVVTPVTPVAPEAPKAPTLTGKSATSVTLGSVSGCEYSIDGKNWQTSPVFDGLSPATSYTFYQRIAAAGDTPASPASKGFTVSTDKKTVAPPEAPAAAEVSDTSVRLVSLGNGVEYSMNGGKTWQTGTTFTGLVSNTTYKFTARYAETATSSASAAGADLTVTTDYSTVAPPAAPKLVSVSDKTVTLKGASGVQFSADDGQTWQKSGVFTVSGYGSYSFVCRWPATDRAYASDASEALSVNVYPTRLTSKSLKVNESGLNVTGVDAGTTCADLIDAFNESDYVTLQTANGGTVARNARVCSGMCLRLPDGKKYIVAVEGDLNGDGEANIFDLILMESCITEGNKLDTFALLSANVAGDKEIDISDFSALLCFILDGKGI